MPDFSDGVMIALYPPPEIAAALTVDDPGALPADDLHMTVLYAGTTDDLAPWQVGRLLRTAATFAENTGPFPAEIAGPGRFRADGDEPHVALVDVPGLEFWRAELIAALRIAGVENASSHGYIPHITRAYLPATAEPIDPPPDLSWSYETLTVKVGPAIYQFPLEAPMTVTKNNTPGSLDWARQEISRMVQASVENQYHVFVAELFTDEAIVELYPNAEEGNYSEPAYLAYPWSLIGTDDEPEVVLGNPAEVTREWVDKRFAEEAVGALTGPIVEKDHAKQIAYTPVLVPGEPDADGDELQASKIEEVAHLWLESFRAHDLMHNARKIDAAPVESYIAPQPINFGQTTIPEGTWMLAIKVRDADVWKAIEDGRLGGVSITAVRRTDADRVLEALAAGKSATGTKRTTLADLGDGDPNGDWVVPLVSIVDRPAVPKAKFVALKAAQPQPTILDRLLGRDPALKEGRRISNATLARLKAAYDAIELLLADAETERAARSEKEDDMSPEEIQSAIDEAVEKATADQAARIDALETALAEKDDDDDDEGAESADESNDDGPDDDEAAAAAEKEAADEALAEQINEAVKAALEPVQSELAETKDKLAEATKAQPKHVPGTEVPPVEKNAAERDAFGRRVR